MFRFLIKVFIKNADEIHSTEVRKAYGILSGSVGIALNLFLFLFKFMAGSISHSIAITADAFNNLSDAGSSLVTLFGFKMAGQKADPDHPFGHGRIEYLSGLFVSMAILFMAYELIKSSVIKIITPVEINFNLTVAIILVVSVLVKFYMYFYNRYVGQKIGSAAIIATAKDSLSDTLSTTVVLLSMLISHFFDWQIDGICGVLIGFFILYTGYQAAKDTINPLLGQAPDPDFVKEIETLVLSYPEIIGVHDLIVHNYGPGRIMISVHAEVPADGDILVLHDTIDNVEHALKRQLQCDAVIHMDPVCIHDEETIRLKELVTGIVKGVNENLSLHDFRLVKGPTHTNVIFDLLIPYNFPIPDGEVVGLITTRIEKMEGSYYAVIDVDKNYA
ncbi:MAG: cation transporter [Lachnospiraceae bacterium]|nr:cation transporter [Lachnospiraceae bacterium]